jgi:hypothetical protein
MSLSTSTDFPDPESQFEKGIKLIITAYETQTDFLNNEISRLTAQIQEKELQNTKLQELCTSLLNDKNLYETKLSETTTYTVKLKEKIDELTKENTDLKKIKAQIRATIDNTAVPSSTNNPNYEYTDTLLYNTNNDSTKQTHAKSTNVSMGNIFLDIKGTSMLDKKEMNSNTGQKLTVPPSNIRERNNHKPITFRRSMVNSNSHVCKRNLTERREQNSYCQSEGRIHRSINQFDKCSNNGDNKDSNNVCDNNGDFFNKCRKVLDKKVYGSIIEIVHLFNHKSIGKDEMYQRIQRILNEGNYKELINDFNKLFT